MTYIENPKTKGSGILCAIPQTGTCPVNCADCFFQSGRSYLEPLGEHLPNLPDPEYVAASGAIVRMNDGNDSNVKRDEVIYQARRYRDVFFNTSIPKLDFPGPVVLTVNPGGMTDVRAHLVDPCPPNLMFVRFRSNPWNTDLLDLVALHYTEQRVPVVVTFMAYYAEAIPEAHRAAFTWRKRTLNSYHVLNQEAADAILAPHRANALVYACGKDVATFSCARCGNCLREYHATKAKVGP